MARRTRAAAWEPSAAEDATYARWRLERLWWWLLRFDAGSAGGELRERLRPVASPIGARERFAVDNLRGERSDEEVATALVLVERGIDQADQRDSAERFIDHLLAHRRRWAGRHDFSHTHEGRTR